MTANAEDVIVVSGLPRSGTSLVMRMLLFGGVPLLIDDARTEDASNPYGYFEHSAVKHIGVDSSCLEAARGKAIKIVAPLVECLVPWLRYRVIFLLRDLRDVVASQMAMLRDRDSTSRESPERLMRILREQRDSSLEWARAATCVDLLTLEFETILRTPLDAARQLHHFVNCPNAPATMVRAVEPSVWHCREGARPADSR